MSEDDCIEEDDTALMVFGTAAIQREPLSAEDTTNLLEYIFGEPGEPTPRMKEAIELYNHLIQRDKSKQGSSVCWNAD